MRFFVAGVVILSTEVEGACHEDSDCMSQLVCPQRAAFPLCDTNTGECFCTKQILHRRLMLSQSVCSTDSDCIKVCGEIPLVQCEITYCICES